MVISFPISHAMNFSHRIVYGMSSSPSSSGNITSSKLDTGTETKQNVLRGVLSTLMNEFYIVYIWCDLNKTANSISNDTHAESIAKMIY